MRKRTVAWALPLTLLLGWAKFRFGGLIIVGALWFLPYLIEVRRHPRVPHGSCNGTGRVQGRMFGWAHGRDRGCAGRGQVIRMGARMFGSDAARREHAEQQRLARSDNFNV
jgi:hypothetical protein